jgi:ABC-type Fe3+ transport system substrate-binding protein
MAAGGFGLWVDDLPELQNPEAKWVRPPLWDKPHETVSLGYANHQLLVNTNLVPPAEEPRTWKELADPKWKDKILIWEPRIPSIGYFLATVLYNNPDYGPDYVRKLLENARITADPTEGPRIVARGEAYVNVGTTWGSYLPVKDGPVKIIAPEDGISGGQLQAVVLRNAPQLNTTKVFLNWMLSREGQTSLSEGYGANRMDIDPVTKEAQVFGTGREFLPNTPPKWDFEMTTMKETGKIIKQWLDELGKKTRDSGKR